MDSERIVRIEEAVKQHYERNRAAHRLRARKAGSLLDDFSLEDMLLTVREYGHRCCYCRAPLDEVRMTFEHPLGIAAGNAHLVVACQPCNSSHGNRPLKEWMQSKGYDYAAFAQAQWRIGKHLHERNIEQLAKLDGYRSVYEQAMLRMAERFEGRAERSRSET